MSEENIVVLWKEGAGAQSLPWDALLRSNQFFARPIANRQWLTEPASVVDASTGAWAAIVSMPRIDASAASWLVPLGNGGGSPMIVVADDADVPSALAVMKSGIFDVFVPSPAFAELEARCAVALEADRKRRARRHALEASNAKYASLSEREQQVLEFVIQGMPNKLIASRLSITERAIEMRRAALMRKLGAQSLGELFEMTLRRKLLMEMNGAADPLSRPTPAART